MTSIGKLAGEVADEVAASGGDEGVDVAGRASSRMRGSSSAIRRGVKPRDTSARMRVWRGGSMARNDIMACARGCDDAGSSETPLRLEKRVMSRKPVEHVGMARQRPEPEPLVAVERRLGAQRGVDRIGILVDLVGVGIVLAHAESRFAASA